MYQNTKKVNNNTKLVFKSNNTLAKNSSVAVGLVGGAKRFTHDGWFSVKLKP
jgi:hypothetical protein